MRVVMALALVFCFGGPLVAQQTSPPALPVKIGHDKLVGKLVTKVGPAYPPLARQARIQGAVVMDVIIDKTGAVTNVHLVSGHPMLAPAAIEAVKKWQYTPYLLNGKPVEVDTTIEVRFQLSDGGNGPVGYPSQFIAVDPPEEENSTALVAVKIVEPVYPLGAGQTAQGRIWVRLLVSETGEVKSADALTDDAYFSKAATDAALQWQFKPFLRDGMAIPETTRVLFVVAPAGLADSPEADPENTEPSASDRSDPEDVPWRARLSPEVMQELRMSSVPPEYPALAKAAHVEGMVILETRINKDGNVVDLRPVSGYQTLANASVEAVKQWRYRPYRVMGMPVEVETQIEVHFSLQ